jgi:GNAT superfamily N-acetyltransferase
MRWTALGRVDRDVAETRAKVELNLPPRDVENFNFAICLREEGADGAGEVIGIGGCHNFRSSFGWPEVGYMFRKEYWGKGFGTEFLRGWVREWDGLEREVVEVLVDERTLDADEVGMGEEHVVRERLIAVTETGNKASQGVLGKCGFEWFVTWLGENLTEGAAPGSMVELPTFRYFPRKKAE